MKKIKKTFIPEIETGTQKKRNPEILRVLLNEDYTRIDFGYVAPWIYDKGGWIKIAPYTFLRVNGSSKRYNLKEAQNIPVSPERLDFESTQDWQVFTLYFEPIPLRDCIFDMIEEEEPTSKDFNFYGVKLLNVTDTELITPFS